MAVPAQTPEPFLVIVFTINVDGDVGKPGPAPASKASIDALPTIKVTESGKDCSICLEEFEIDGEAREMPCKHVFHSNCVEKWLRIHGSCPFCRYLMPAEDNRGGVGDDGGEGGPASLDHREIGLAIMQSFLAVALAGSAMGSGQVGEGDSSAGL